MKKWERCLLIIMFMCNVILLMDKFDFNLVGKLNAETKSNTNPTHQSIMKIPAIACEKMYTNETYVLGYDLLKLHEQTINLLLRKGLISKQEGDLILLIAKNERWLLDIGETPKNKEEKE